MPNITVGSLVIVKPSQPLTFSSFLEHGKVYKVLKVRASTIDIKVNIVVYSYPTSYFRLANPEELLATVSDGL